MQDVEFRNVTGANLFISHEDGSVMGGDLRFNNVTAKGLAWDVVGNQTLAAEGGDGLVQVFGSNSSRTKLSPLTSRLSDNKIQQLSTDDPWITLVKQVLTVSFSRLTLARVHADGSLPSSAAKRDGT